MSTRMFKRRVYPRTLAIDWGLYVLGRRTNSGVWRRDTCCWPRFEIRFCASPAGAYTTQKFDFQCGGTRTRPPYKKRNPVYWCFFPALQAKPCVTKAGETVKDGFDCTVQQLPNRCRRTNPGDVSSAGMCARGTPEASAGTAFVLLWHQWSSGYDVSLTR